MAYVNGEWTLPRQFVAALRLHTGLTPATTKYETGYAQRSVNAYATIKSWTVAGDIGILLVYRIDPARSSSTASGKLRVQVDSVTQAEMSVDGTESGDNFLVGLAFDTSHQDNIDFITAANGSVINLDALRNAGTFYADWHYVELDLN